MGKRVIILGGGLSGITLAHTLQNYPEIDTIDIIEKEEKLGGLCRSFKSKDGIDYDIGPHIFFSKNKDTLEFMKDIMMPYINSYRRSNQIIHKRKFVQYPFENDLGKLDEEEKKYVLRTFNENPYENLEATNMRQFFLKTFGKGICDLYLLPYNEKIWKYDLSFMDLQMVERIPKPPTEDILKSINGETVDGYTHQLNFFYPEKGGCQTFIDLFVKELKHKVRFIKEKVVNIENGCINNTYNYDILISTIPLNEFTNLFHEKPNAPSTQKTLYPVKEYGDNLVYNGIEIFIVNVEGDIGEENFAFMTADKNIEFHRLSKLDYFGKNYHKPGTTTFMIEVTKPKEELHLSKHINYIKLMIENGLMKLFGTDIKINNIDCSMYNYAYVINDINQKENKRKIFEHYKQKYKNIYFAGRFGSWQYLNMDQTIENAWNVAKEIKNDF